VRDFVTQENDFATNFINSAITVGKKGVYVKYPTTWILVNNKINFYRLHKLLQLYRLPKDHQDI